MWERERTKRKEIAHLADPELALSPVCHSSNINKHMQQQSHTTLNLPLLKQMLKIWFLCMLGSNSSHLSHLWQSGHVFSTFSSAQTFPISPNMVILRVLLRSCKQHVPFGYYWLVLIPNEAFFQLRHSEHVLNFECCIYGSLQHMDSRVFTVDGQLCALLTNQPTLGKAQVQKQAQEKFPHFWLEGETQLLLN